MQHTLTWAKFVGLGTLLLAMPLAAHTSVRSTDAAQDDRLRVLSINSTALGFLTTVDVLLPADYTRTRTRYPVLYIQRRAGPQGDARCGSA